MTRFRRVIADQLATDNPYRQWVRIAMERDIQTQLRRLQSHKRDVLEVSGDIRKHLPCRSYRSIRYPDIDLSEEFRLDEVFDIVWCEQVLEHVERPDVALNNLFCLTRPGGTLIVSTPFLIRLHALPRDFWRFTPRTLGCLLADAGFEAIEVKSWGNSPAVLFNLFGWVRYRTGLPMHNSPRFPVTIWAYARRPEARGTS